jgi:hypothetical protein
MSSTSRFNATRVVLLIAAPIVLFRPRSSSSSKGHRKPLSDFLIPLAAMWMILALGQVNGGAIALKSGALEFVMSMPSCAACCETRSSCTRS